MTNDMASTEEQSAQTSARYKRKLTDARREQNRRAQKLWRERQKKQRDEDLKDRVLKQLTQMDAEDLDVLGTHDDDDGAWVGEVAQDMGYRSHSHSHSHHSGSLQPESTALLEFAPVDRDNPTSMMLTPEHAHISPEAPAALPDPEMPLPVAIYYYVPPDPDAEDMRFVWPVEEDIWQKMYTKPPAFRPAGSMANTRTTTTTTTTSSSLSGSAAYPNINPFLTDMTQTPPQTNHNESSTLPSLYLNHLQLVGESCFAATLSIAQCLAISRSSYINDHPSPFSPTMTSSPLSSSSSSSLSSSSSSSSMISSSIPIDLRPTPYQLLLPHPCYLDCIPFPHFRNMAVYLSSLKKLDHCSLFLDLIHDGLVCWGRARANSGSARSMRDGVAWSKRSWEARPWFWRKWGWLARLEVADVERGAYGLGQPVVNADHEIDDADGMLSGSQWWWAQQAEDDGEGQEPGLTSMSNASRSGSSSSGVPGPPAQEEFGSLLSRVVVCNVGIRNKADIYSWD